MMWLRQHKPGVGTANASAEARARIGSEVGDLAMGYFGDYVEVTSCRDGKLDIPGMIERTREEIAGNAPVICEASFCHEGLFCAVDLLCREAGGWSIYEVKSSTHDNALYLSDIAYQKYVLEQCGLRVTGTYLMYIDNTYIFDGTLDLRKLFRVIDVAEQVAEKLPEVAQNLTIAGKLLADADEPDIRVDAQCGKPHECEYWDYCTRHLPQPNVFDLYNLWFSKMLALYHKGIYTFEALTTEKSVQNVIRTMQIDHALHEQEPHFEPEKLREFLDTLTYPLYFLDFESVQPAVPKYVGTKPYAQIPFQYSLHILEHEGGELLHKEFLAEAGTDPLRPIAEALCRDIPKDVTVLAYNKGFECGRLRELAGYFPDLAEHLLNISENVRDLVVPFRNGWYYNKRMGGSFSIKSVLPAIFPDDPSLDYHNLEGIHNGGEAMNAFPAMEQMSPEELAETRKNLLKYCELDTYAMVKVWEALKAAAGYETA
ncbi:MAG: DUF2779 domain-containing protein [Oscillospiraceae bacterium]|nr:DUF2779 domain-containing protein [Oscillospiraceae bacterium]